MKEHPILFSGAMVRGLLNLEIGSWPAKPIDASNAFKWQTRRLVNPQPEVCQVATECSHKMLVSGAPFKVGDHLWVRETWQDGDYALNEPRGPVYRATDPDWETGEGWKWIPSIHMPKWASRITLEVMEVRVQRLQEISEEDAKAEGVECEARGRSCPGFDLSTDPPCECECSFGYSNLFAKLWNSIYGVKHHWATNPWTWSYSLKRIK